MTLRSIGNGTSRGSPVAPPHVARPLRFLTAHPLLTRWNPGPVANARHDLFISVTDYSPRRLRHTVGVYLTGLRLRRGWYAMQGAVGLWLWALPWARRSGAISIWRTEEDLQRFVSLPLHEEIMRRYRERGKMISTSWTTAELVQAETLERATRWIMNRS